MFDIDEIRKRYPYFTYVAAGAAALILIIIVVGIVFIVRGRSSASSDEEFADSQYESDELIVMDEIDPEVLAAAEEAERLERETEAKQAVVDSYDNLGIVKVSGYLNVRKSPDPAGDIIGKMQENSVCNILEEVGDWYHIESGGVDGYISSQYVLTGEEAREAAFEEVKSRAIVMTDNLNIRSSPEIEPDNIIAQALYDERYVVADDPEDEDIDGWIHITSGYISSDYAVVELALNEARKMDLKAMAISQYNNLLISKVSSYLNIRSSPEDAGESNVIGKLTSNAAGDIIEELDGWYKIQSGGITGYVTSDPQYTATGDEAVELGMNIASLMAVVNTDRLNVRTEPSMEAEVWTQISKDERYEVLDQLDGWVQIELDAGDEDETDNAFISTRDNNVEVRYSLPVAIKFDPLTDGTSGLRNRIVNYALQFVGNRYVWGGTSLTNGADCSGFVQSVMKNFGISLPRVSRDQANAGRGITSDEMRPGDLIFYGNSKGTINHVAMYIGNGQIVHAASTKSGIKISTWNYRTPQRIRNVID